MEVYTKPDLVEYLTGIGGIETIDVVKLLRINGETSDFDIAHILGLHWSKAREIMNKLYNAKVVTFRRIRQEGYKDKVYLWTLEEHKLENYFKAQVDHMIDQLKEKLSFETDHQFFMCEKKCSRMTFEDAMGENFCCPKCQGELQPQDNSFVKDEIEFYIHALEEEEQMD